MSIADNKELVRRALKALDEDDRAQLAEVLAPDATLHQCGFLHPIPARAIFEGEFPGQRRVRDREVRLERIIGEDDVVAVQWRTSGRFVGTGSSNPDGIDVSFPSMTFIRIRDGKIVEIWNIQDTATLQTQLWEAENPSE